MLLEGVRSLDEAVEEVRDDRRQKEEAKQRRREQERLERAQLKAISRGHGHRGFPGRGGRPVEVEVQQVERAPSGPPRSLPYPPRSPCPYASGPPCSPCATELTR